MNDYSLPKRLAFVDLETTGLDPKNDRVMEVGVLVVEDGHQVAEYNQLVNPGISEDQISTLEMTGINYDEISHAPRFDQLGEEILQLMHSSLFVAHNAKFDYEFLREEYLGLDIPFELPNLCSVKLSRELYPEFKHHDLTSLTQRLDIQIDNRHRAYDDAAAIWEFFKKIQSGFEPTYLNSVISRLIEQPVKSKISNKNSKKQMGLL